ncbi:hypothetical protein [Orenia marismortui]|uniref:Uncharacterized protein n=1 Tax=Orenia marismortui TaxID=46469 RepID=A0A4R8HFX7_9FIRM|nr:hypothetical protein [Orenia marismortui]TDX59010.1 hypothetical protein C7959_102148 [Orenia marismortui]
MLGIIMILGIVYHNVADGEDTTYQGSFVLFYFAMLPQMYKLNNYFQDKANYGYPDVAMIMYLWRLLWLSFGLTTVLFLALVLLKYFIVDIFLKPKIKSLFRRYVKPKPYKPKNKSNNSYENYNDYYHTYNSFSNHRF